MKITIKRSLSPALRLIDSAAMGIVAAALLLSAIPAHADNLVQNGGFEINSGSDGQVDSGVTIANWNMANPGAGAGGGGFGSPNFPGYTFLYAAGTADVPSTPGVLPLWGPNDGSNNGLPASSPGGGYFIGQDSAFEPDAIEQTITGLTAGGNYTLDFDWAAAQQYYFGGPTNDSWTACLGADCQTTNTVTIASQGFAGWFNQSFNYTATGSSEVLMFYANGDDVPSGLPNPSQPPFALLDDVSLTPTPEPGTLPLLLTGLMGGLGVLRSKKWLRR